MACATREDCLSSSVVKSDMARLGFEECRKTTGVYIHRDRDMRVVTHVDDFLGAGEVQHLKWLRDELENTYELKVQIAGWQPGDAREVSFLGRTISLFNTGIGIEGDDKHVKKDSLMSGKCTSADR